ncbi:MAG: protein kinase [Candidatus Obscuribacterales bacterium]
MVSGLPDRYEIIETFGEGGMGVVYRALDTVLKKEVAIKALRAGSEAELAARFQREARTLSRLSHRNVVGVLDFGVGDEGMPYMVMDFAAGRNLARILDEEGPLSLDRVASIMSQLCDGLGAAHRQGIIHRDLKPANVIVGEDGESITIVDFGLARFVDGAGQNATLTRPGTVMGSPFYMSPEQVSGVEADNRSDIYSLGCILFKLLTGSEPFRGETAVETLLIKSKSPPPVLSSAADRDFPPELDAIIEGCLALSPGDRFATVEELAAKLSEALGEPGTGEPEPGDSDRVSAPSRAGHFAGPAILLLVSGLLLFWLAAWYLNSSSEPRVPAMRGRQSGEADNGAALYDQVPAVKSEYNQDRQQDGASFENVNGGVRVHMAENRHLEKLPKQVAVLELSESKVSSEGFDRLWNKGIKSLKIWESGTIDLKAARSIAHLETLDDLEFNSCSNLKNEVLAPLVSLPRLRRLSLTNCGGIDDGIVDYLASMPALESLDISGTSFEPASLPRLAALKRLSTLGVARLNLKDEDMHLLSGLAVKVLVVSSNHALTAEGIGILAHNPSLRQIDLRHCQNVTAEQLQALRKEFQGIRFVIESKDENRLNGAEIF